MGRYERVVKDMLFFLQNHVVHTTEKSLGGNVRVICLSESDWRKLIRKCKAILDEKYKDGANLSEVFPGEPVEEMVVPTTKPKRKKRVK